MLTVSTATGWGHLAVAALILVFASSAGCDKGTTPPAPASGSGVDGAGASATGVDGDQPRTTTPAPTADAETLLAAFEMVAEELLTDEQQVQVTAVITEWELKGESASVNSSDEARRAKKKEIIDAMVPHLIAVLTEEQKRAVYAAVPLVTARGQEFTRQEECAKRLGTIGDALKLYVDEFPTDLGTLAIEHDIGPEMFLCPSAGKTVPADYAQKTPQEKASWINANTDYEYVGKGLRYSRETVDTILVYEKPENHPEKRRGWIAGAHVIYVGGRVEHFYGDEVETLIRELREGRNPPAAR